MQGVCLMYKKICFLINVLIFTSLSLFSQNTENTAAAQSEINTENEIANAEDTQIQQAQSLSTTNDYLLLKEIDLGSTNYISYDSYINSIKNRLPSIELNVLSIESSENNLTRAKSSGDVNLGLSLGALGSLGYGAYTSSVAETGFSHAGLGTGLSIGSLIPYSGTTWQVSLTNSTLYYLDLDKTVYQPTIVLTVAQPLLRNFFGMNDRYQIEDARFAVEITKETSEISNNYLLVAYQKTYYQWVGLEKSLEGINAAYENAKKVEAETLRRYRSGLVDNDVYQQSKAQTFYYMDLITQYREQILSLINTLRFFIDDSGIIRPDHQQWTDDLEKAMAEEPEFVPFNKSSYGILAEKNGMRIANNIAIQKNLSLPDLSLVGSISTGADDNTGYFTSISSMTNLNYFIGFQFSYAIGDRASKANLRDAEIELDKFNSEYRNMVLDYNTRMQNYRLRYNAIVNLMDTKKNRIASLESALVTQNTKYRQGRIELSEVMDTEIDILSEKLNLNDLEYQLINNYHDYRELFMITHKIE